MIRTLLKNERKWKITLSAIAICFQFFSSGCNELSQNNQNMMNSGGTDDFGNGIAVDNRGNVYVTGETDGSFNSFKNKGSRDILLIKYDANGGKQWETQWGTDDLDEGFKVSVDQQENVYVTGISGGDLDGLKNQGNNDVFLAKYDGSGQKLWTHLIGSPYLEDVSGMAIDSSGNVYLTGETWGNFENQSNQGLSDAYLVKFNSNGAILWTQMIATTLDDTGNGITVDHLGNIYVSGYTHKSVDSENLDEEGNGFLAQYNSDGEVQWQTIFENDLGGGVSVNIDEEMNSYVCGYAVGDTSVVGDRMIYLSKFDFAGVNVWNRRFGSDNHGLITSSGIDSKSNVYVTGFGSGDFDSNLSNGSYDVFLVKYNSMGEKQWSHLYGTGGEDIALDIAIDSSDNIYLTGDSSRDFGGNKNSGPVDGFVIKLDDNGQTIWSRLFGTK
ncbi:SBBP repeat-containing protein [Deltaproteobacteria bacterium TL4]